MLPADCFECFHKFGFIPVSEFGKEKFRPFETDTIFADLSYTLLYGWEEEFSNLIKVIRGNAFIISSDIHGSLECSVAVRTDGPDLKEGIDSLREMFREAGRPFILTYVDDRTLASITACGFRFEEESDRDFSDYVYDTAEFLKLEGNRNRPKRHELQRAEEDYPDIQFREGSPEERPVLLEIFEGWCSGYSCDKCVFGCERRAFERMLDAADPEQCRLGIVSLGNEPVAFMFFELGHGDTVLYHIKKYKRSFQGLNYYIHYHTALMHPDYPYMNWAEDMGMEGLRLNKMKYHPCRLVPKHTLLFQ